MVKIRVETDPRLESPDNEIILNIVSYLFNSKDVHNFEISFVFGNDNLLNSLKKEFFKLDELTDVIAFRINDYSEKNIEGEIYISIPRAKENAKKFTQPFKKEMGRLIIHGCLHLLGFEDTSDDQKAEMTKLEDYYLDKIDWEKIYA